MIFSGGYEGAGVLFAHILMYYLGIMYSVCGLPACARLRVCDAHDTLLVACKKFRSLTVRCTRVLVGTRVHVGWGLAFCTVWVGTLALECKTICRLLAILVGSPFGSFVRRLLRSFMLFHSALSECSVCRVFFVGPASLPSVVLGKVLLSVTTTFTRAGLSAQKNTRQRHFCRVSNTRKKALSHRLKLMAVIFAESRVLALDKKASLPSVPRLTLGRASFAECLPWTLHKVYFYFIIFPTKLFVVCCYTMLTYMYNLAQL
jgi:hypothetical protein